MRMMIFCMALAFVGASARAQYQRRSRPSVSPADSAAALRTFRTADGGSGPFFQYRISDVILVGKQSTSVDTMTLSVTDGGESRNELGLMGDKTIFVGRMPGRYSVTINPRDRTYRLNVIDTASINNPNITYQVTKVGSETIGGYNCVHAKLAQNIGRSETITMDVYTSKDVPGYATLKGMMTMANVSPAMYRALDNAGCGGLFVKMTMHTKQMTMDMVLITANRKTFPASLFEIPSGYTPAAGYP